MNAVGVKGAIRSRASLLSLQNALAVVFLGLLAAVVLAQANPFLTLPNRDAGYNLYAGSLILKGRLPYVDFWNTKGPAIYFLNALGLYFGHGLRWGVWAIEYLFLLGGILLLFVVMRRQWGAGAAAFGVIVAMAGLNAVFTGGNLTEEYALFFNAVALYLFWSGSRQEAGGGGEAWRWLLIGCMAGLSFSFRANNIGVPAAIGLAIVLEALLRRQYLGALRKVLLMGAGFLVPVGIGLLYFWARGALGDYVEAVYLYNIRYSGSRGHPVSLLFVGFAPDKVGWPAWIALAGALLAVYGAIHKLARRENPSAFELMLAAVLWIEIVLSSVSWRMFTHYFISWMPAMALLSGWLLAEVVSWVRQKRLSGFMTGTRPGLLYGGLILGVALVARAELAQYGQTMLQMALHRGEGIQYRDYMSDYVIRHTQPGDTIVTWPANAWISFASERESAVRLVFYPVFDDGTITEQQGKGYLEELMTNRPALIIDCSDLQNEIPSLDAHTRLIQHATRDFLFNPPYIEQVFDYVATHYHMETKSAKCVVYRRNP